MPLRSAGGEALFAVSLQQMRLLTAFDRCDQSQPCLPPSTGNSGLDAGVGTAFTIGGRWYRTIPGSSDILGKGLRVTGWPCSSLPNIRAQVVAPATFCMSSNGDGGDTIFRHERGQRLVPNLCVKLFAVPDFHLVHLHTDARPACRASHILYTRCTSGECENGRGGGEHPAGLFSF